MVYAYGMTYQTLKTTPAMLVDTMTGTVLDARMVVAVPMDVYNENEAGLDGASDSTIGAFGERYGFPIYVFVMDEDE